ncbi:MAG: redoxin family protein [Acidobacteria bacterium]|jgi:thiol-disulfide isomerase/thioredoxin|nr:redoxin family protein [Acidobacteriota bacterium]
MKKNSINWARMKNILLFGFVIIFAQVLVTETFGQKQKPKPRTSVKKTPPKATATVLNLPKVTQIDEAALKNLLKRDGEMSKPLLINFWATWCDPCREEFPELVKIDADYKGKIDFITISLDDSAEINREVPKFLVNMKAEMPAYLLKTDNEEAAIASVTKDWQGGLPFTVLLNEKGEVVYIRQGKIKPEIVRGEIDKTLPIEAAKQIQNTKAN